MGRGRCSGQPWSRLVLDAHTDGHGYAKGATTLHDGFPDAAHQQPISHSNPETGRNIEKYVKMSSIIEDSQLLVSY